MRKGESNQLCHRRGHKIAKSEDLDIWASCKHNEYVEFGEKLALVCLESSGKAYFKRHK